MSRSPSTKTAPKKKPLPEITEEEAQAIAADWEDEMFGEDADYMRAAWLADEIGNK